MRKMGKIDPPTTVFFDFDNTITASDVLDDLLRRFSRDDAWQRLEKKWAQGKINAKDCLMGQINGLRISKQSMDDYLPTVALDPSFAQLLAVLNSRGFETAILSDNFDYLVRGILRCHGIRRLKVYANKIAFSNDRLIPRFPYQNRLCPHCAHCKGQTMLLHREPNSIAVFLGDGLSDICAARRADIVFAKDGLLDYLRSNDLPHIPFQKLSDVMGYFENGTPWLKNKF